MLDEDPKPEFEAGVEVDEVVSYFDMEILYGRFQQSEKAPQVNEAKEPNTHTLERSENLRRLFGRLRMAPRNLSKISLRVAVRILLV